MWKIWLVITSGQNYAVQNVARNNKEIKSLGPDVQSIINLTSSLMAKRLTVRVSTISNSQVFFAAKATHIFSAQILVYMPYLMIKV